jgi:rRNA maturation endonuclease Nob1
MERNKNTTIKWMDSRWKSKCGGCGDPIEEGERIAYDFESKVAFCESCGHEEEEFQLAKERKQVSTELEDMEKMLQ